MAFHPFIPGLFKGIHEEIVKPNTANDINLSGNIIQWLFIILKLNFLYISGKIGRRSSTVFGFSKPCWYSYSYHNNQFIFGQGDMTCLRNSKRSLKPSKTKYPLGKHSNNIMPYKIIPRYGLRAIRHNAHSWGTFWFRFFEMYYKITGSLAKLDRWNTRFGGILLGQTPAIGRSGRYDRAACRDMKQKCREVAHIERRLLQLGHSDNRCRCGRPNTLLLSRWIPAVVECS